MSLQSKKTISRPSDGVSILCLIYPGCYEKKLKPITYMTIKHSQTKQTFSCVSYTLHLLIEILPSRSPKIRTPVTQNKLSGLCQTCQLSRISRDSSHLSRLLRLSCILSLLDMTFGCGSGLCAPKSKKGRRMGKWKEEWKQYNMKGRKRGPYFVHCNTCCTDFSYRTTI